MKNLRTILLLCFALPLSASAQRWKKTAVISGDISIIRNRGGQTLGYSEKSGVKIIIDDGYAFKDLNKNGKLDPYEAWRIAAETRANDLA